MPKFTNCLNQESFQRWIKVCKAAGVDPYHKEEPITLEAKMENTEEIGKLMTVVPGFDRGEDE